MSDFNILISNQYADISDQELDAIVSTIKHTFPNCGNKQLQGHLLSQGYRVQQQRIRDAQRRIDPEGSVIRRLRVINRREYRVAAPQSLWHMDGNHKLIRYAVLYCTQYSMPYMVVYYFCGIICGRRHKHKVEIYRSDSHAKYGSGFQLHPLN